MWQPITDQHEYDEKASVALEVDPTHKLRELVNYKHVQPEPLSFLFDILSISSTMLNSFLHFVNTFISLKHSN